MFRKFMTSLLAMMVVVSAAAASAGAETVKTPAADGSANIRSGAGMNYAPVAWAKNGDEVELICTSGNWVKVKLEKNGKVGFIYKTFVDGTYTGGDASTAFKGNAKIKTKYAGSNVNLRKSPDGAVIASIKSGTAVSVLAKEGDWCKVQLSDGQVGYVYASYVSENGYVTTANVNLRSGKGTEYAIYFTIPKGTPIQVNGVGSQWSSVTVNGQTGYISNKYYKAK